MGHVKIHRHGKEPNITFYIEKPIECNHCTNEIGYQKDTPVLAVHMLDWTKKGLVESVYHEYCFRNHKPNPLSVVPERKTCYVVDSRPHGSVLVIPRPPDVRASNRSEMGLDFLNMAYKPSVKTNDRTVYSGYESIEGASVGASVGLVCDEQDQLIGFDDGLKLFDQLQIDNKKAVAEHNAKLLGGKDVEGKD